MPNAPLDLPDRISGFRSRAINGLIEFAESMRLVDSSTVKWQWTPDGVSAMAIADSTGDLLAEDITTTPWEIVIANDKRTKVTTPASGGMQTIIMGVDGPITPTAGSAAYATTYDLASIANDQYFYIKVANDGTPPPGGDTVTFEKGTSWPANSQNDTTGASEAYWRLWYFKWDAGASRITEIEDWRNVPQMNMRS